MKIANTLVLAGALLIFAAEPKGGLAAGADAPPPVAAGAAGARKPVARICSAGTSQNLQCLAANGAIGPDGQVSAKAAAALLKSGHCPCEDRKGGTSTSTIPSSGDDN